MPYTVLVEQFSRVHADLETLLASIPHEAWAFKPDRDEWSIHEIIVHLADSEAHCTLRTRMAIAQPGSSITPYDQEAWANTMQYGQQDTMLALDVLRTQRRSTAQLLTLLHEDVWTRTIHHPERGILTLERVVQINTDHIQVHMDQIEANYRAWQNTPSGRS